MSTESRRLGSATVVERRRHHWLVSIETELDHLRESHLETHDLRNGYPSEGRTGVAYYETRRTNAGVPINGRVVVDLRLQGENT